MRLLGRSAECEVLDRLLADASVGRSQVVVLRGEAGVGKSALLDYISDRVAGWRVARAVGIESELELAYSGLHQLCRPMLDHLDRLPIPQRDALATVFGLSAGPAPDGFLVGLATLTLFAEVAEKQPLVCFVEDAQWLDEVSAQILGFVARRLLAERIAIVCAARTGIGEHVLAGLPELSVHGLEYADARALLLDNVHGPLDSAVRDQIIAESHGNPLALLEFPRTWSATDLAGGFGLLDSPAVASKIEDSYTRRLVQFPRDTQLLVLVAAAEPRGDLLLLHRAAQTLGVDMAAADPAVGDALLKIGGRVEFAHPLARSAAYRAAAAEDRHRAHRALAEATDPEADPDRRAWHRARATPGPDEEVAVELERSAARAQSRGGLAATAAFLEEATLLTVEPARRAQRALVAAQAKHQAGALDSATRLLATAEAGPLDEVGRARVDLLRAQLAFASPRRKDAPALLLQAARQLEPLDIELARDTYFDAMSSAMFVGRFASGRGVLEVAQAVRAAPVPPGPPRPGDVLLDGLALLNTAGYAAGAPVLKRALDALRNSSLEREDALRWLWLGCHTAHDLWDDESWDVLSARHAQLAREMGALNVLPIALTARIGIEVLAGELALAASHVEEAETVTEITGSRLPPYAAVWLAAWRGDEAGVANLIESKVNDASPRGEGVGLTLVQNSAALLYNALGRYEEAFRSAQRSSDQPEQPGVSTLLLVEFIEAACRSGHLEDAADALSRLSDVTSASGTNWALGLEARSRALLTSQDVAEGLYRQAIEALERTRVRTELARAHLVYGEWLRRENRRVDARAQLRTAHELFVGIGMEAFAERARRELLATGEKVRRRIVQARDELTAQERQIALLARDGLSNSEIGSRLFISPRTVEWHLRKVFGKLGISSRRGLQDALPTSGERAAARAY
jgi:DNA-binding CsgD family transcriptional regulator